MSPRFVKFRSLFARLAKFFSARTVASSNARDFSDACRELAFWSASDAGLDGPIEAFDGSRLHLAADGMCTIRMTLADGTPNRSPADAAALIVRSLTGLRVLLLIEIDGRRFVSMAPNVNPGVREIAANYTNRTERTH